MTVSRPARIHRFIAALFILLLTGFATTASGQPAGPNRQRAEALTAKLAAANKRYQAATQSQRGALAAPLVAAAAERYAFLAATIADDPSTLLRVAVPASVRRSLPQAAQVYVEQQADVDGSLEVLVEDYEQSAKTKYFLHSQGRRFALHFAADAPGYLTGDRVRVRGGVVLADSVAVPSGASIQPVATVAPYTFGEQRTLMILVNFQDKTTQPYTVSTAYNLLFNTVGDFYRENSQQQTWLTGDVAGWFTIPVSSTTCDSSAIRTAAQNAAKDSGINLSNYRRFIYGFPSNACSWWGLGQVGGSTTHAWINGSIATRVVGHELGHNFGLHHAHALECGATTLGTNCTTIEYGDPADILGISGVVAHFNAFAKERLGWLNYGSSLPILTVTGSGSFTIDPYAAPDYAPKALKILKEVNSQGKRTFYYVEHRRGISFDSGLSNNSNIMGGVLVHTGSEATANSSFVLDMTPSTSSWTDAALTVGQSFSDPASGVTLTTMVAGSGGATVDVTLGSIACVSANPTVSLSPSTSPWVMPGTKVTYTMSVKNNDNVGCSPAGFSLSPAIPAGWTSTFSPASLTLSPGASASTSFAVTSAAGTADGFYTVTGKAASGTRSASASGTYTIMSSLSVSAVPGQASYSRSQQVTLEATVLAGQSGASGASVTFTIQPPSGKALKGTATTNASGKAVYSFKLKPNQPPGLYQVGVNATLGGLSAACGTSFTVK